MGEIITACFFIDIHIRNKYQIDYIFPSKEEKIKIKQSREKEGGKRVLQLDTKKNGGLKFVSKFISR